VAGIGAGWDEGLEVNVLGLVFGLDVTSPGLKLPGIGRVGIPDRHHVGLTVSTSEEIRAARD